MTLKKKTHNWRERANCTCWTYKCSSITLLNLICNKFGTWVEKVGFCPQHSKVHQQQSSPHWIVDISSFRSVAESGMDDSLFFQQWPMSSLEELSSVMVGSGFCEDLHHQSYTQQPVLDFKRAAEPYQTEPNKALKQLKTTTWNSCKTQNKSNSIPSSNGFQVLNSSFADQAVVKPEEETWSSSSTLTFPSESMVSAQSSYPKQNFVLKHYQGPKKVNMNARLGQAQEHIIAERKRREKLSQRFIALSTLIPGLKKMDKASVLGDAIKHMKQLQDKVKILEEQNKKKTMESVVYVKKYECYADGENSSPDESFSGGRMVTESLPEIEARFCNKDVLISINCEKKKRTLEKIVAEIEKLHLSVVNSSAMSFGDSALYITIIAQKDEEFSMNTKEVVTKLRSALKTFM